MANGDKFIFRFDSRVYDNDYEIRIRQQGYTGDPTYRALGGSPVLRRDRGDLIDGTSLEWPAECLIDEEFASLYTSDPKAFSVVLLHEGVTLWQGFLSTELYSDPETEPPYDVTLTATDGLGELKNATWEGTYGYGQLPLPASLSYLFTSLLSKTGQTLPLLTASSLRMLGGTAAEFFSAVYTDINSLSGKSCYEVLTALLESLHARLTFTGMKWLLYRETDADSSVFNALVASEGLDGLHIGGVTRGNWVIDRLSRRVEPARSTSAVVIQPQYRDNLLFWRDEGQLGDETKGWVFPRTGFIGSDGALHLMGGSGSAMSTCYQQFTSPAGYPLTFPLTLSITVASSSQNAQTLKVRVAAGDAASDTCLAEGTNTSKVPGRTTRGGVNVISSGRRLIECSGYRWTVATAGSDASYLSFDVPANEYGTASSSVTYTIDIPIDSGVRGMHPAGIFVELGNQGSDSIRVLDVTLSKSVQLPGFKTTIKMNNGARGEDKEHNLTLFSNVATASDTAYTPLEAMRMMYGALIDSEGAIVQHYQTDRLPASGQDFLPLMAQDYALSVALPRLVKTGTVSVPALPAGYKLPIRAYCYEGGSTPKPYIVNTLSWDLLNDEMELELISHPAATLTATSSTDVTQGEPTQGSSPSPSLPSAGGGDGGSVTYASVVAALGYVPANSASVPAKTSQLTNDSGFITSSDLPAVPTKVSQLTNDSGYLEEGDAMTIFAKKSETPLVLRTSDLANVAFSQCAAAFASKQPVVLLEVLDSNAIASTSVCARCEVDGTDTFVFYLRRPGSKFEDPLIPWTIVYYLDAGGWSYHEITPPEAVAPEE